MSSIIPAKSILKQPAPQPTSTLSTELKAKADRDKRNLDIALYHANKIQTQKNVTAQNLSAIETLATFPATQDFTSAEAATFLQLIKPFQPSDFDDLVEERVANSACGYALCSRKAKRARLGASAAWRLQAQSEGDFCSRACLRKALYVRAQLSETPAWERQPGQQPEIVLHDDSQEKGSAEAAASRQAANEVTLAAERGDSAASLRPKQVIADTIVEKELGSSGKGLDGGTGSLASHRAVEGYEPKVRRKRVEGSTADDDSTDEEDIAEQVTDTPMEKHTVDDEDAEESWQELYKSIDGGTG